MHSFIHIRHVHETYNIHKALVQQCVYKCNKVNKVARDAVQQNQGFAYNIYKNSIFVGSMICSRLKKMQFTH